VANTPTVHNVIVCTLCSCYPTGLLGFSPAWYKSRAYRSRVVRDPRAVLREFGLDLPPGVSIRVHDSTADCRYMVLPLPPAHLTAQDLLAAAAVGGGDGESSAGAIAAATGGAYSHEQLRDLITRDSMIGVAVL
jgi:nitrile hydratase subunit alpha